MRLLLILVLTATVAFAAPPETEWPTLQTLLQQCSAVCTNPLPPAETRMLSGAPLLGNGEVGAVIGCDERRYSLFLSRADFRRYALGGVDLVVEGAAGDSPSPGRHVQDLERAEIRSEFTLAGRKLETTSWLVPDQPLLICEVNNPSDKPLKLRVNTWTRPGMNLRNPFRIVDGMLGNAGLKVSLSDQNGDVIYDQPTTDDADLWRYVEVNSIPCLVNVGTGRYLATTAAGKIVTLKQPDATAAFKRGWRGWHERYQFRVGGRYLNMSRGADGQQTLAIATQEGGRYGTGEEYAAHRYFPESAGHQADVCWAWRSYGTARGVIVTRVLGADVNVEDASHLVVIPAQGRVTLAIAVTGDYRAPKQVKSLEQCREQAEALVKELTLEEVNQLSGQRVVNWRDYWLQAWLDTGDRLLNRFWYGSMYLLKSANRPGQQSPALYGIWNTSDNPACGNWEFNNYNYEAQHYGTFTANRAELATPQLDDILKTLPSAQQRAARAGYQGAMWQRVVRDHYNGPVPTNFPPPRVAGQKNRRALGNDQLDAPAFLAMNFLYAYETTLDRKLLKNKVYPMVRTCMDFYTDYLTLNQEKNRYELHDSAAREGTSDNNPAYPLAFIKRLATACADYSEVLGVDAGLRPKWRDIARRMSAYPTTMIGGKKVFRETESNPRVTLHGPGDNVSLLQIIHPGAGIGLDSDKDLLETARNTLAWVNSDKNNPSWLQKANNLPLIFTDAATIGWDAADLYYWFHRYLQEEERPNLSPQAWGMESIGATEAIHRMMFQSHEHVFRFFPVWPKDKDAQFHRLRAFGAFLVSAELKHGEISGVKIVSEKGRPCTVQNPWPGRPVRLISNGKVRKLEQPGSERFTFNTTAGEIIELKP